MSGTEEEDDRQLVETINVETTCISTNTIHQISVIMRFLEIQCENIGDEIHRDT